MEKRPIVQAQPTSARVYRTGCVVTTRAKLELRAGDNTCLIDCLPEGIAEDSIRVRVPSAVALLSVNITHEEESAAEEELEHRLTACEREVARVAERKSNRNDQKELWIAAARPQESATSSLAEIDAFLSKLPERLDALDDQLAELEEQRLARQNELDEVLSALREVRERRRRGLLLLRMQATEAGSIPCEIVLRSDAASWHPVYDVLVESFEAPLRLRLRAEVTQRTGWDWNDVALILSTASPSVTSGALPRLFPLRLRKHVEMPAPRMGMMGMGVARAAMSAPMAMDEDTMAMEDALDSTASLPLVEAAPPQATQTELANSVEYEVPGTWTIAADTADGTLVEVMTQEVGTTYQWLAVPLADDAVHMVAALSDALAPETLGYEASVYLEGAYCGKALLEEPPAGKPFEISLGTDARMRTSRKLVKRQASRMVLRGRRSEETTYELVVESQHAEPKHVVLLDQVPVAQDKEIWVELGNLSQAQHDAETGELRWELDVEPGGAVARRLTYTVSHPKDMRIDRVHDAMAGRRFCRVCGMAIQGNQRFCPECGSPC